MTFLSFSPGGSAWPTAHRTGTHHVGPAAATLSGDDVAHLERLAAAHRRLRDELAKTVVGQNDVIEQLLLAILAEGHCLLEGVPGLAKTLMVNSLAKALDLSFSRIQFTPDLMPADITGTEVIQEDRSTGERVFKFIPGPIFANIILADEINRTPPKTQAALLEAMQERQVTTAGTRRELPPPFFVLATQNPIEQEGTYPLPEAQQDRFMFKVFVKYPNYDEEYKIAEMTTSTVRAVTNAVLSGDDLRQFQALIRRIPVPPHVIHYALRLVRATRIQEGGVSDFINEHVSWGAGPRAVQFLLLGAKARAALLGHSGASIEDIQAVVHPVLRHRVITGFRAEAAGITPDRVVDHLLESVSTRATEDETPAQLVPAFAR